MAQHMLLRGMCFTLVVAAIAFDAAANAAVASPAALLRREVSAHHEYAQTHTTVHEDVVNQMSELNKTQVAHEHTQVNTHSDKHKTNEKIAREARWAERLERYEGNNGSSEASVHERQGSSSDLGNFFDPFTRPAHLRIAVPSPNENAAIPAGTYSTLVVEIGAWTEENTNLLVGELVVETKVGPARQTWKVKCYRGSEQSKAAKFEFVSRYDRVARFKDSNTELFYAGKGNEQNFQSFPPLFGFGPGLHSSKFDLGPIQQYFGRFKWVVSNFEEHTILNWKSKPTGITITNRATKSFIFLYNDPSELQGDTHGVKPKFVYQAIVDLATIIEKPSGQQLVKDMLDFPYVEKGVKGGLVMVVLYGDGFNKRANANVYGPATTSGQTGMLSVSDSIESDEEVKPSPGGSAAGGLNYNPYVDGMPVYGNVPATARGPQIITFEARRQAFDSIVLPPLMTGDVANLNAGNGANGKKITILGNQVNLYNGHGQARYKPSDVTMFHEMVHCSDFLKGILWTGTIEAPDEAGNCYEKGKASEMRAVGVGPFGKTADNGGPLYSENTYRKEKGLPVRTFYTLEEPVGAEETCEVSVATAQYLEFVSYDADKFFQQ